MSALHHMSGETVHVRKGDMAHQFRYAVDYVLLDPAQRQHFPWVFSRNRFNLFALRDRDHGGAPGKGQGVTWLHTYLARMTLPFEVAQIKLLAQPRVAGYVFNPVSFWLCFDGQGELRLAIAEVTNTFGDRHAYLCKADDFAPIRADMRLDAEKVMHVSPFQPIAGAYTFRFDIQPDRIGVWIDFNHAGGGVFASLTGKVAPASSFGLLKSLFTRRIGARRVMALIHWQALWLKLKGATYRRRPVPQKKEV